MGKRDVLHIPFLGLLGFFLRPKFFISLFVQYIRKELGGRGVGGGTLEFVHLKLDFLQYHILC